MAFSPRPTHSLFPEFFHDKTNLGDTGHNISEDYVGGIKSDCQLLGTPPNFLRHDGLLGSTFGFCDDSKDPHSWELRKKTYFI